MAGYLGYGLKSAVQGFQTGFNLAQQKSEMDWQKKQKKRLEEAEAKLKEEATLYNSVVTQAGADGFFSDDEMMKINTTYLAMGYRTQESLKGAHDALLKMDKSAFDREMEYFNGTIELLQGGLLDPKDASAAFEYGRKNWATSDKVKSLYEAADNIYAKSHGKAQEEQTWERGRTVPSENRAEWFRQQGIEIPEAEPTVKEPTFNEKRFNWKIDQLKAGNITTDQFLKSEGMYIAPEKMSALEKEIQLSIKYGATNEEIKNKLMGKGEEKVTPEGEITAGQKRTFDMASSVMFGSSDWVTGISKPGIISMDISNKLNMGQKLTEEENTEVRNNYNAIKDTLPDEIRNAIESQLKRYGISLEAPAPITPEPTPEPEPGIIQKGIEGVKGWLGMKGTEKDYTTISEEELYNLAMAGDKQAYEEAKRRGLIK